MEVLAIIGARSGSKSVRDKNIALVGGKPLLGRIIETARASRLVNRVVVSTDSAKYAALARDYGAETPFLRPAELAQELSPEFEYVRHALRWLEEKEGYAPDIAVRCMATVPLQQADDIDGAILLLAGDPSAESAVVVAEARQHPLKALKIIAGPNGNRLVGYFSESGRDVTPIARQNYAKAYYRANVIAFRPHVIERTQSLTGDEVRAYVIPQERGLDIDSDCDLRVASFLANSGEAGK
jgi:CMP-N,N'-diacetyllegionaminic acid synthase